MSGLDDANHDVILIADDDPTARQLLRRLLEFEGYGVDEAENGVEALQKIALSQPSLVLVDAIMPQVDGFEVCAALRKLPQERRMPVVMVTSLDDEAAIDRAFEVGADDYLVKPIHWPTVRQRLRRLLLMRRAEKALEEKHDLLRTLIDNMPDYIFAKDIAGRFTLSNVAHARSAHGAAPDDLIGKTAFDLYPPDLASQFHADDMTIMQTGEALISAERTTLDPDGKPRTVLTTKVPLRNAAGTVMGLVGISRDITERTRVEQALRDSQANLASAQHIARLGSWELDLANLGDVNSNPLRWSDELFRIFGYEPGDIAVTNDNFFRAVHPDDRDKVAAAVAEAVATGQTYSIDHRIILPGGLEQIIHEQSTVVYDAFTGKPLKMVGTAQDITERRRAEEALQQSETAEREQRILAEALRDTAAILATTHDSDTVLTRILENVGRIVPHGRASILLIEEGTAHATCCQGWPPDEEATFRAIHFSLDTPNLHAMITSHAPLVIPDTMADPGWLALTPTVRSYVGAPIWVRGQVIGFFDLNSVEPGFFTPTHAERLQAFANQAAIAIENANLYDELRHNAAELEQRVHERTLELSQAKEHVETILNNSSDAILVVQPDETISRVNPAFTDLFGYPLDEIAAQPLILFPVPDQADAFRSALTAAAEGGESRRIEMDVQRKDGTMFNADLGLAPIIAGSGNSAPGQRAEVVCSIRDITAQKQVQRELQDLNRMKTEFLTIAAHELRTPLTTIQGYSEILSTRTMDMSRVQRYMQLINEQSLHLHHIIDDLLDISRLESQRQLALNVQPVNLAELVDRILAPFIESSPRHQFQVENLSTCPTIKGDSFRLSQVLQNLLSNAVRYSPRGGRVVIRARLIPNFVELCVQDDGIGMTADQQTHLFERFYRADTSNTSLGGVGLGLAISKLIVEVHGGRIWADTQYGNGSAFYVTLPFYSAPP